VKDLQEYLDNHPDVIHEYTTQIDQEKKTKPVIVQAPPEEGIGYIDVLLFLVAVALIVGTFFLRGIIVDNVLKLIKTFLPDQNEHKLREFLGGPISFLSVVTAVFIARFLVDLPPKYDELMGHAHITCWNIIIFYLVYVAIDPVSKLIAETGSKSMADEIREITVKVIKLLVLIIGFLSVLDAWGVNVSAFLAGLGLVGMAVALAAGDTMKNFFGSVVVLADKIFSKGNWIKTPQVEGIVEKFGLRTTVIRGFDDSVIHIPNATLADTTIVNFSKCDVRQITWTLPLGCPITEKQATGYVKDLQEYLDNHPDVIHEYTTQIDQEKKTKPVIVQLDEFGENCIKLFVYFFVRETAWIPYLKVKRDILLEFKRKADEHGVGFGVPTRSIFVHKVH